MSTLLFLTQEELYSQIKLEDIPGIGPRILRRLLKLGITFPHILRETPLAILVKEFGNHEGQVLYNLGRGIDHSPVVRNELMSEEKSFSHSYTLPKEIYTYEDSRKVLLELCEMVGRRMRKKGFSGRTIGVFMRFTDMTACFERKTFKEYTNDGLRIFRVGEWLLQKTWAFRPRKRLAKPLPEPRGGGAVGTLRVRMEAPRARFPPSGGRAAPNQSEGAAGATERHPNGYHRDRTRLFYLQDSTGNDELGPTSSPPAARKPIRQVGIWVTNLIHEHNLPLPLFEQDRRYLKALRVVDQINDKHGEFTVMRAPVLEVYQKVQKIPDGRNRRQFTSETNT